MLYFNTRSQNALPVAEVDTKHVQSKIYNVKTPLGMVTVET